MERFLLLWDELDDLAGAGRHLVLNAVHAVTGAATGALEQVGRRMGAANLRVRTALGASES